MMEQSNSQIRRVRIISGERTIGEQSYCSMSCQETGGRKEDTSETGRKLSYNELAEPHTTLDY